MLIHRHQSTNSALWAKRTMVYLFATDRAPMT